MCDVQSNGRLVVVSDFGKAFALRNDDLNLVTVTEVDGCAITEGIRCDYLYTLASSNEVYVELKGSDIRHAVDQISVSIRRLSRVNQERRVGVVVASRVPKADTSTQIAMAKIRKSMVCRLVVRSGHKLTLSEADLFV